VASGWDGSVLMLGSMVICGQSRKANPVNETIGPTTAQTSCHDRHSNSGCRGDWGSGCVLSGLAVVVLPAAAVPIDWSGLAGSLIFFLFRFFI
jgi:hypothetical protein